MLKVERALPASWRVETAAWMGVGAELLPLEMATDASWWRLSLANSGLCGLRQNPNYFQLEDCSDSCCEREPPLAVLGTCRV